MAGLPPMLRAYECFSELETENRPINKHAEGCRGQKKHYRSMKRTTGHGHRCFIKNYPTLEELVCNIATVHTVLKQKKN